MSKKGRIKDRDFSIKKQNNFSNFNINQIGSIDVDFSSLKKAPIESPEIMYKDKKLTEELIAKEVRDEIKKNENSSRLKTISVNSSALNHHSERMRRISDTPITNEVEGPQDDNNVLEIKKTEAQKKFEEILDKHALNIIDKTRKTDKPENIIKEGGHSDFILKERPLFNTKSRSNSEEKEVITELEAEVHKKKLVFENHESEKKNEINYSQALISIKNADVKYNLGKESEFHALKSVNLEIYSGEFIIFFGPSGCGKSTLVNLIAGLERPSNGNVTVGGEDILKYTSDELSDYHTEKIGLVFQAYNLIDSLSIEDNVALPQMFREEDKKKTRELVNEALERFEIQIHAKKAPAMLSGGQQQRVGIARALVNNPGIILADEPIGNLDSASAAIVVDIFRSLNKKDKKTILLVTHNPDLLPLANRILHMKDGCIVSEEINEDTRPEDVRKKEAKENDDIHIPKELKLLMRTFGSITDANLSTIWMPLKSKMIARRILQKYTIEQTEAIEQAIKSRLMGISTRNELFEVLDQSLDEGGAGLDKRAAKNISERVEEILYEVEKVKDYIELERNEIKETTYNEDENMLVVEIRRKIMRLYHGHLKQENIDRLDNAIRQRLKNEIDKKQFIKTVSISSKNEGAGFNKGSAKKFSRELELLMLIKFGEEREN